LEQRSVANIKQMRVVSTYKTGCYGVFSQYLCMQSEIFRPQRNFGIFPVGQLIALTMYGKFWAWVSPSVSFIWHFEFCRYWQTSTKLSVMRKQKFTSDKHYWKYVGQKRHTNGKESWFYMKKCW